MNMQAQPQPDYGQQQPQYGAPPLQQAYGAPQAGAPMGMPISMPPAEIKWSGLSTGGAFKVPVISFIGRLTEVVKDSSSQYGLRIIEKYDQVQILESPVPWPWATIDISIKYSDRESSGWGYHVESAKKLGLATQAATLDQAMAELVGKAFELRQSEQSYGEDKATGAGMKGDVWRFQRIVVPGQPQAFPQPQYAVPPAVPPPPTPPVVPPPAAMPPITPLPGPPVAAPEAVAAAAPVPPPPPVVATVNVTLDPSDTAAVRAKKLLHGRALNEWLGVALVDDKIKADPAFINTIYDQSFIVGLKASNQVLAGTDGKFAVIA